MGSSNFDTQRVYTETGLAVGTPGTLDGAAYVWCSYTGSTALVRGEPLVAANIDDTVQNLAITTTGMVIGQTDIVDITAGAAAISANAFEGGFMAVVDGAGEGTIYRIRHHAAFTASSADGSIVLDDAVEIASDADTEVSLLLNKYAQVQRSKSHERLPFVGVPNIAVPAGDSTTQYFWAQRSGYCPAFVTGSPKRGTSVVVSNRRPGRFQSVKDSIEVDESISGGGRSFHSLDPTPVVGQMVTDAIDEEVQIVDLQNTVV